MQTILNAMDIHNGRLVEDWRPAGKSRKVCRLENKIPDRV